MAIAGTIQNGQVQLDHPADMPDGTRVTLLREEVYEYPHPMAPYDREKEFERVRAALARKEAGELGRDVDDVFDDLEKELDSPPRTELSGMQAW